MLVNIVLKIFLLCLGLLGNGDLMVTNMAFQFERRRRPITHRSKGIRIKDWERLIEPVW